MAYSKYKLVYATGVECVRNVSDRAAADLARQTSATGLVSITKLKTAAAKNKTVASEPAVDGAVE